MGDLGELHLRAVLLFTRTGCVVGSYSFRDKGIVFKELTCYCDYCFIPLSRDC